jgi:hypothetical protein
MDHAASEEWREPPAETAPEPVAEPEPETPETPEPAEDKAAPEEDKPKPKEHKSGWQKRIDKLTARNHMLESRIAEFEAKQKPTEESKQEAKPSGEPKLADFGNDVEKFLEARDAWKENSEKQAAESERRKVAVDTYNEKVSKARGEYEDWDEVVTGSKAVVPQAAIDAVIELDNGPDVAYYLAQHPEETESLMGMSAIRTIQAISKISDKVAEEKAAPPPKNKVKPPEPLTPVGGSATRSNTPLDQLSIKEYMKIRNKQERESRNR